MSRTRCHGPDNHTPTCRLGRPLCRWRRAKNPKYAVCNCTAEHFPHRAGWCKGDDMPRLLRTSERKRRAA